MKPLTVFILISFIGIGVFGYTLFHHDMNNEKVSCIAFAFGDLDCPPNTISMAFHHISAVRSFSSVLSAESVVIGIIASLLLLLVLILFASIHTLSIIQFSFSNILAVPLTNERSKKLAWLSLLEHSPSVAV